MALTGTWFDLNAGDYRARVSEIGAGLVSLHRGDRALTPPWAADQLPPMSCGAVLIPWPNRLRDGRYNFDGVDYQLSLSEPARQNASHGLVRWERWDCIDRDEGSVTLALALVPQTGFPFELGLRLRYALDAERGLTVALTVDNLGVHRAPFGAGFHPYLDFGGHDLDHAEVAVPARTMLITDERQIPVGREPVAGTPYELWPRRPLGSLRLDHGYTDLVGNHVSVSVGGRTTELWWSEEFRYLQVFTPPIERFGATALAVEPMTCPANAFNSGDGLIVLEPGAQWSAEWGIRGD